MSDFQEEKEIIALSIKAFERETLDNAETIVNLHEILKRVHARQNIVNYGLQAMRDHLEKKEINLTSLLADILEVKPEEKKVFRFGRMRGTRNFTDEQRQQMESAQAIIDELFDKYGSDE